VSGLNPENGKVIDYRGEKMAVYKDEWIDLHTSPYLLACGMYGKFQRRREKRGLPLPWEKVSSARKSNHRSTKKRPAASGIHGEGKIRVKYP